MKQLLETSERRRLKWKRCCSPTFRASVSSRHRMDLSPAELALRANLALAQGLMFRATAVRIEICGNARTLVRHAKLRGLICTVVARGDMGDAVLELSGPFSLFRRTLFYGRALGTLVPLLGWSRRFRLRADCVLRDRRVTLCLATGDPIFPAGVTSRSRMCCVS